MASSVRPMSHLCTAQHLSHKLSSQPPYIRQQNIATVEILEPTTKIVSVISETLLEGSKELSMKSGEFRILSFGTLRHDLDELGLDSESFTHLLDYIRLNAVGFLIC